MKSAAITGVKKCELVERPEPLIRDYFVKVKVTVAPLCTEFKNYQNGTRGDALGHEAAGVVAEVAQAGRLKPGDRVVVMPGYACGRCELCAAGDYIHCENNLDPLAYCQSPTGTAAYAQYLIKPYWLLLPIPEDISTEHAAMACCGLGPTFGAMQRLEVEAFDSLLICGLGPVGLGGVINAAQRGARVIGVESNPYRAQLALQLGAEIVLDPNSRDALDQVRSVTGGRGVDAAIDCTGVPAAQKFAIRATRRRGKVAFVGWGGRVEMDNMVPDGLTLMGVWHWNLHDAARMWQVIRASANQIERLITHRFPMSRIKDAWELQMTGRCGKVLVDPWA